MSETAILYYHKPKIRRTNLRKEMLMESEYTIARMSQEAHSTTAESRLAEIPIPTRATPVTQANFPQECTGSA